MSDNTIRDLAVNYENLDAEIMSHLTKESGILQTALAVPASHNMFHKYKKVTALPSFSVREVGGSLTSVKVEREMYQADLKMIDAKQTPDKALCDNWEGGPAGYFEDQKLPFLESWGQTAANLIVYGNNSTFGNVQGFHGFWQITNASAKVTHETGDSGSTTSIFAVKWNLNSCALLFNKKLASAGDFIKAGIINDGKFYMDTTSVTGPATQPVYGVLWESYLGLFSGSVYDMARYDRIQDASTDQPTVANMDKMLDSIKADSSTFLYMNRTSRRLLKELKDSKLELGAFDKDYGMFLDKWNGVRIVIDDNILDTETTALD